MATAAIAPSQIARIKDPIARAVAAHKAMKKLRETSDKLANIRRQAATEARVDGHTHAELARALDVTNARAAQLARDGAL